jgi:septal ring factor EnvC (AmiA/AmiB activator)
MAEASNDLIYEVLKSLQNEVSQVRQEVREVKAELQALRSHMAASQQDVANIYTTLVRQDHRLDRIERRLELTQPAH